MPAAPQTAAAIKASLLDVFPSWASEPDEILNAVCEGVAAVWERVQAATQTLHDRTFIDRADGSWLDQHGAERSKPRNTGESDVDYRVRIRTIDEKLIQSIILSEVNAVLVVGTATLVEHEVDDPGFVPPAGTTLFSLGFVGKCNSFSGTRAFTLILPDQAPLNRDTAFTGEQGQGNAAAFRDRTHTWDQAEAGAGPNPGMYTADQLTPGTSVVYAKVIEILDRLTAAGVEARPIIA